MVNARNRMGGYTGSTYFVVVLDADGMPKFVNLGTSEEFDIVSSQCRNSVARLPPPPRELLGLGTTQPAASVSIADELQKLADLKNSGALTEAEFQAAKARLLATPSQ